MDCDHEELLEAGSWSPEVDPSFLDRTDEAQLALTEHSDP
jgi:hypothetical protein